MMNVYAHLSVSLKYTEALNDIFNFIEMKGDSLIRHVLLREISLLLAIEKILKCWLAVKSCFQSVRQKE